MRKKDILYEDAKRLYLYDMMSIEAIARRLKVNRKTIMAWCEEGNWKLRRSEFIKSKSSFHEEMYDFARKLMQDIQKDISNGEEPNPSRFYTLCKFIPLFAKVQDYEEVKSKKKNKNEPKGLSPETIARIEAEVLGITDNDEFEPEGEIEVQFVQFGENRVFNFCKLT